MNWQQLRQETLERDNYLCQTCLKEEAEDMRRG